MARLNWSERSLYDLETIAEFIANDSVKYAKITVTRIREKTKLLTKYPELGRIVPEINNDNIREIIFGNYRIIYTRSNNQIYIVTVHHSAKPLQPEEIERDIEQL